MRIISKNPTRLVAFMAGVLMMCLWLVACAGPATGGNPYIMITEPPNGAVIPAPGDVTLSVKVSNFRLVEKLGQANVAGEGHIHYFMDVDVPTAAGKPAITTPGTYAPTAATSYTWHNVGTGPHTFSAELVNNDHTPLNRPVIAEMMVSVAGTTPAGSNVTIDLTAHNVAFDKKTITVSAGATVVIHFNNADSGIPHNFALYTDSSAANPIFVGETVLGPATKDYKFTAPTKPGTYFFRCDVHPTTMTGSFIVT